MKRILSFLAAVSLLGADEPRPATAPVDAASLGLTRRDYDTPGLTVETGARTAALDVMIFTDDGKFLLTAGDDKVVRTFAVTAQGLQAAPESEWPILRWPVYREHRGNIYTASLSPDQKSIVIAGNSQTADGFGACILNRTTGQIEAVTARITKDAAKAGSIWSSAYHVTSTGRRLVALGTEKGGVWVWDVEARTQRLVASHVDGARRSTVHDKVRMIAFQNAETLVSIGGNGVIQRTHIPTGETTIVQTMDNPIATPVTRSADGKRVAWIPELKNDDGASASIVIGSYPAMDDIVTVKIPLNDITNKMVRFPNRLHLSWNGQYVAVAVRETDNYSQRPDVQFYRELGGQVFWADLKAANPKFVDGPRQTLYAEAVAFHPQKPEILAIGGGDNHELALWDLNKGQAIGKPFVGTPTSIWNCVTSLDNRYVAFQTQRDEDPAHPNRRGKGDWQVFDFQTLGMVSDKVFDAERASVDAQKRADAGDKTISGGWKVVTKLQKKASDTQWYLLPPDSQEPIPLEWNRALDEFPRCYTFVPKDEKLGRPHPIVLVGHYWGFSAFECNPGAEKVIRRIRTFRGHEGYVTGIAVSADGTRVVTSSRDMTLCGWSLGVWPSHKTLGAEILKRDGKAIVGRVDSGSPLWEVGLDSGDEIVNCSVIEKNNLKTIFSSRTDDGEKAIGSPDDIVNTLSYPIGGTTYFTWKRGAITALQSTSFAERPIWRMLPQGKEWIVWRWRDHYYATSTNGDRNIGWQKSYRLETAKKPEFYRAEQFREIYNKPDSLRQVFDNWRNDSTKLDKFVTFEPPKVVVSCPASIGNDGELLVKITMTPVGNNETQGPRHLYVWLNDYLVDERIGESLPKAPIVGGPVQVEIRIPAAAFRSGTNSVFAQVLSNGNSRGDSDRMDIHSSKPTTAPRLLGRFFGVGDYRKSGQSPLSSHKDAKALAEAWQSQKGKAYTDVDTKAITDGNVTPASVLAELRALEKLARPEDIVIVALGGHGARKSEFQKLLSRGKLPKQSLDGMGRFAYLTGNFNPANVAETTLDFQEIQVALQRVNARKIVLLDACHSGAATSTPDDSKANPIRMLVPHDVGCAILAACKETESALEDSSNSIDLDGDACGFFSIALRRLIVCKPELFDPADAADGGLKDGQLNASELASALAVQMDYILKVELKEAGIANRGIEQHPDIFVPKHLKSIVLLKK